MSSTVTGASWANIGTSGNWGTASQWNPASVPGATTNVLIGTAASQTTAAWTVTVAGAQAANSLMLDMGSNGTLSVTGALAVTGLASLGYGSIGGATVDLGAGAALSVGGNMVALHSIFMVNGATVSTGGYADLDAADVVVQNNGVWNADTLWVGQFNTTGMTVAGAGAAVHAAAVLNLGGDGGNSQASLYSIGRGTVAASGGADITAGSLNVIDGSVLNVDAQSSVVIGSGPAVAGAVAIGSGAAASLEWATVGANVVDNGAISAQVNPAASTLAVGTGPVINGTLSGTGSLLIGGGYTMQITNAGGFAGNVTIAPGGTLKLEAAAAPSGPIHMAGGTLDLTGLAYGTGQPLAYDPTSGDLTIGGMTLNVGTGLTLAHFKDALDSGTGTLVTEIACYVAGTRVATAQGEAAVETLRPGDALRTAAGRIAPVRWVGRTTLDLRGQPHAAPVRIAAGAFAPGVPRRDLLVSGDHAIAFGNVLIPARRLVNDTTVRQDLSRDTVTYVHVELDRHDLLLAEGLAAESYLDTGNRGQFDGAAAALPSDADAEAASVRAFAEHGCAPLVLDGKPVQDARTQLRARADALGWRLVEDPAVRITADRPGIRIAPGGPDTLLVTLPPGLRTLRLASRSFIPAALDPAIPDGRRLGAALALDLDGLPLVDDAAFGAGWYPPDPGVRWRWTDGAATLVLPGLPSESLVTVRLLRVGARYWVRDSLLAQAA